MSLAPLPNNSSKSLPLSSEGLTTARMVSDPRNGLAHAVFADLPDFAEIMTHIDQGASAPTSIQANDCCSGSEVQAVSEKTPAAAEDLHMDIDTSAADEPLFAAAFAETSRLATQDLPNGDETGERRPVLQPAAAYAESANAPVSHRNLAESAESETHLPEPDPPAASRQSRDDDTASAWPLDMTAREGEVTRVKDRVISLQEFTFVAGAARSGMSATMHDAAKPATYSALYAAGKEDGGLPHDGRDASSRPATETESAQKPQLTAVAVQTGSVGASSFALSLRDAVVGSQEVTVPEPDATPAWHEVAGRQRRAPGTETHGPANGPGLPNLAMGAAASTASLSSPSHAPQSAADLPGASDQRADMSLTGKADPLRSENKSPFPGPAGSGGPAPLPMTTEDLAWDERRADSYGPLIQPEKAVVNRLKASVLDMPSSQAGQGIAPFATNLAGSALLVGGGGHRSACDRRVGRRHDGLSHQHCKRNTAPGRFHGAFRFATSCCTTDCRCGDACPRRTC